MSDQATVAAQNTSNAAGQAAQTDANAQAQNGTVATSANPTSQQTGASQADQGNQAQSQQASGNSVVPEKYDLKLPEGSLLDPATVEKISSFAKERGLSNEQAQAILERESASVSEYVKGQEEGLKAEAQKWVETIRSDKEIGGDAFNKSVEHAKRLVDRYATADFKKVLDDTGLGNHPELVRMLARIGKAMADDTAVLPGTSSSTGQRSAAEIMYGR